MCDSNIAKDSSYSAVHRQKHSHKGETKQWLAQERICFLSTEYMKWSIRFPGCFMTENCVRQNPLLEHFTLYIHSKPVSLETFLDLTPYSLYGGSLNTHYKNTIKERHNKKQLYFSLAPMS